MCLPCRYALYGGCICSPLSMHYMVGVHVYICCPLGTHCMVGLSMHLYCMVGVSAPSLCTVWLPPAALVLIFSSSDAYTHTQGAPPSTSNRKSHSRNHNISTHICLTNKTAPCLFSFERDSHAHTCIYLQQCTLCSLLYMTST